MYGAGRAGIQFKIRSFLSGLVAKTAFPMQGTWVQSLVRELDPTCSHKKIASLNERPHTPQ